MTSWETEVFHHMFPRYVKHLDAHPSDSLLTRMCGVYSIKMSAFGNAQDFLIMENIFPTTPTWGPFDLKGSSLGRSVAYEDRGGDVAMKDLDFIQACEGLEMNQLQREKLILSADQDTQFLLDCQITDYSLLLGGTKSATDGAMVYHIAIIDLFQTYNLQKKLESNFKTFVKRTEEQVISAVNPGVYRSRFMEFLSRVVAPAMADGISDQNAKEGDGHEEDDWIVL
eukprot:TRINITY_DN4714_c0_g1_i2.p1 TRINITY_DN4714_c0_g1~~TRINITY_DN4714_c0_g1_i2.p1  ORF type:complete len:226 (-),score=68.49 TRINITY_DN4714_c0_g1_i2:29-706(-)